MYRIRLDGAGREGTGIFGIICLTFLFGFCLGFWDVEIVNSFCLVLNFVI